MAFFSPQYRARAQQAQAQVGQQGGYGLPAQTKAAMTPVPGPSTPGGWQGAVSHPLFQIGLGLLSQPAQSRAPINPLQYAAQGLQNWSTMKQNALMRNTKLQELQMKLEKQSFERLKYENELRDRSQEKQAAKDMVGGLSQELVDKLGIPRDKLSNIPLSELSTMINDARTEQAKEWDFYLKSGGDPNDQEAFKNFLFNYRRAGADRGPTQETAYEKELGKQRGQADIEAFNNIRSYVTKAPEIRAGLQGLQAAAAAAQTGPQQSWLAPLQFAAEALGFDTTGWGQGSLADKQALKQRAMNFVLEQVGKTKGAVSNVEWRAFVQSVPNLLTTQEGVKRFVDFQTKIIQWQERAWDQMQQEGVGAEGAATWLANYARSNPVFTDAEREEMQRISAGQDPAVPTPVPGRGASARERLDAARQRGWPGATP